ncbi:MAG TPA: hypothetical protein DGT23_03145 [Micromonosporaceae bacterium]|nr:hypothetical protein [Micromonosporaceae bacterium]
MRGRLQTALAVSTMFATTVVIAAAPAQATTTAPETATVTSIQPNSDGTITETTYTPAGAVTPDQLAQKLRASGVQNVSVRKSGEFTTMAAACSYGTARTWPSSATCFVKWSKNGAVRPIIDFVDHSGASWPVGRAVTKWNETSGIDSIYRPKSSGCDGAPAHCVNVYSGNYGDNGWYGLTSRTLNSAGTYYTGASVKLNDYYGGSETEKWSSACHELGHVLGLDHNTSNTSCLYTPRSPSRSKYPNGNDFTLLERYY